MSNATLHSQMIKFALTDTLFESRKRYEDNDSKLNAFEKSLEDGSSKQISGERLRQKSEEIAGISKDQEQLSATIPELVNTKAKYLSLTSGEEQAIHRRLSDKSGELKLVLQNRRSGEILAQAS